MDRAIPDAQRGHWVDHSAPSWMRPYLRLARIDRPIGWWLLVLPCWWSAALVASSQSRALPSISDLILFLIGAVAMKKINLAIILCSIVMYAHAAWKCKEDGTLLTWSGQTQVFNGKLLYKMEQSILELFTI